jgi:uncharacterized protein (TIGR03437 family)
MNEHMRSRYIYVRYVAAVLGLSCALNQFLLHPKAARTATLRQVTAVATADFDEDGMPDLAEAGVVDAGGGVRLQRGNQAAVYPNSLAAQSLRAQDAAAAAAPFLPTAVTFSLPVAPDWLAAGDFDADGHADLAAAARGDAALYWLRGDGQGKFESARSLPLPGSVTAWQAGEVNRADGLADLVIGVRTEQRLLLLVYEGPNGALQFAPERFALPAEAASIALGDWDGDAVFDLAVAAGERLWLAQGRDRRLSHDRLSRAAVRPARVREQAFSQPLRAVAAGAFTTPAAQELAVLLDDGALQILVPPRFTAETEAEVAAPRPSRFSVLVRLAETSAAQLIPARISSQPTEQLVVLDPAQERLQVVDAATRANNKLGRLALAQEEVEGRLSLNTNGATRAVLPLRLNGDALHDLVILPRTPEAPQFLLTAPQAVFTVTNTNDSGAGSLRQAIADANNSPGADNIVFRIGGGGQALIMAASPYPSITEAVTIDGTTQPGFAGAPLIGLSGYGLVILGGNSVVRGLSTYDCNGIYIETGGNNIIEGNYIGTTPDGISGTSLETGGVTLYSGNNRVGGTTAAARNILSSTYRGVLLATKAAANNLIQGNYIGLDVTGAKAIGRFDNIGIDPGNAVGTVIGGTTAGAGNVISGGQKHGIHLLSEPRGTRIQGNLFGLNAAGTAAVPNYLSGIYLQNGPDTLIGGTTPAARNVVSGHQLFGLEIYGNDTSNVQVQGNYVGTDITGLRALGNQSGGIAFGGVRGGLIGGTVSGARNVVVCNASSSFFSGVGISLVNFLDNVQVQGNYIGTNATGTAPLGTNNTGIAVDGPRGMRIGGTEAGAGNLITNNQFKGIAVLRSTGISIRGNQIFSNGLSGIDLGDSGEDGVSLNDPSDGDMGPNQLQNYPLLTGVTSTGNATTIKGLLNSAPNAAFTLDFYANDARKPDGTGEGQRYLGAGNVMTDAQGNAGFTLTLPATVGDTSHITATATDAAGNTSEFSLSLGVNLSSLTLSKLSPSYAAVVLQTTTYVITVVNPSANAIANVTVTDNLPPQMQFTNCTATDGGVCGGTGNNRTITFASLPANSAATITLGVRLDCSARALERINNTASVSAPNSAATPNSTATSTQIVALRTILSPPRLDAIAEETVSSFRLTTTPGCPITVTSNVPWLSIVQVQSNGFVTFRVSANPDAMPRTGTITAAEATFTVRQVSRTASVSAASFRSEAMAADSIVALFGAGLANTTASGTTLPLPTVLADTQIRTVDRNGTGMTRLAPLFFVSPTQINFLMPTGVEAGSVQLFIETSAGHLLASGRVNVTSVTPGLFAANANGQGVAAALALRVKADGTQSFEPLARLDPATNRFVSLPLDLGPANEQVFLVLFGTGWRARTALSAVTVKLGGVDSEVQFAGAQGALAGVDQLNVRLPRSLIGRGEVDINLTVDSKVANVVSLALK